MASRFYSKIVATLQENRKTLTALRGFFMPPVDALWGVLKGTYHFFKSPKDYFWTKQGKSKGDRFGKRLSATAFFSRAGTITLTTICVLGFIGALAFPFPGIAPIYTIAAGWTANTLGVGIGLSITQAVGITFGWSALGRLAGSLFGSLMDYIKIKSDTTIKFKSSGKDELKSVAKKGKELQKPKSNTTISFFKGFLKNAFAVGFIGEIAPHVVGYSKSTIKEQIESTYDSSDSIHIGNSNNLNPNQNIEAQPELKVDSKGEQSPLVQPKPKSKAYSSQKIEPLPKLKFEQRPLLPPKKHHPYFQNNQRHPLKTHKI